MKMRNKIKKIRAFSLVETIIYLAIFTMVSILVINSFITVMSSFATTRSNRSLLEAGISSMERMSREIRQASSIDLANSNLGLGTLQLNSIDINDNLTTIKFKKENSTLNIYQAGTLSGSLVDQNIVVDSLIFRRIATAHGEAIKIEMILSDARSKINKTESFYNTIILRGGY
jgi:Tfp pilus assembly protein PilW